MINLLHYFFASVYWYFRPLVKWFLRKTTSLCELQRICYGEENGFSRASKVELCLSFSRTEAIQKMVQQLNSLAIEGRFVSNTSRNCVEYACHVVMETKNIKPEVHRQFIFSFRTCLFQIYGYKQLIHDVEVLRKTPYSSTNEAHEEKLSNLWGLLKPDEELEGRMSKQWSEIGFQGDDPKTDFRGMGILGLENLLYFATEYTKAARHVLLHSCHPKYGYSYAIVGINLTSMAYHMLKNDLLKVHLYNIVNGRPFIQHFHHIYCYLFYEFDKFWLEEKPRDIMEFNRIRDKFEASILKRLENPHTAFKLNFAIDTL